MAEEHDYDYEVRCVISILNSSVIGMSCSQYPSRIRAGGDNTPELPRPEEATG